VIKETSLRRRGVDAAWGQVTDYERLAAVRKLQDEEATRLMWLENRD
jgi:hypothetical protein